MTDKARVTRRKAAFALATGTLYIVFGTLQMVAGLGLRGRSSEVLLLGGGFMDGLMLIIVGMVFLQGDRELRQGLTEGVAFVYMGILLALFFLFVLLSQVGASYLGAAVVGGDWADYSAMDSVTPALYLSLLPLAGLWAWRGGFSLMYRGTPGTDARGLNNVEEG